MIRVEGRKELFGERREDKMRVNGDGRNNEKIESMEGEESKRN